MSDIGGFGDLGNDPQLSALQWRQQGAELLQQQQGGPDIAAQRNRETQLFSGHLGRATCVKILKENSRRSAR